MATPPTVTPATAAQQAALLAEHQARIAARRAMRGYPEIAWNFEEAQPPSNEYVTRDSYILTTILPTTGGSTVTVAARLLLPNGKINVSVWNYPNLTALTKAVFVQELMEGFLLSLTVSITPVSGVISRGDTFVDCMLQFSPAPGVTLYRGLVSAYITTAYSVGWPEGPLGDNLSGPGYLQELVGSVPGAGTDFTLTMPANTRVWIHSLSASLTTSSTAANRLVDFVIKDGSGNVLWNFGSQVAQIASLTYTYNGSECVLASTAASVTMLVTLPTEAYLLAGWTLGSSTSGIQAGDQWTAPRAVMESWVLF